MSVRAVTWSPRWRASAAFAALLCPWTRSRPRASGSPRRRWSSAFAVLLGTWPASRALASRFSTGRRRRLGAQTAAAGRPVGGTHHPGVEQGLRHAAADRGLPGLVLVLRGGHRL